MIPLDLVASCAPANVAPQTIAAIIKVESGGDPLALHVDVSGGGYFVRPTDVAAALAIVNDATQQQRSVDIGLMQVNSSNLQRLGLAAAQLLDPCTNIRAGAAILSADYAGAAAILPAGQKALQAALSAYNTGNYQAGFFNGYVARYYREAPAPEVVSGNPLTAQTNVFHRSGEDEPFTPR